MPEPDGYGEFKQIENQQGSDGQGMCEGLMIFEPLRKRSTENFKELDREKAVGMTD